MNLIPISSNVLVNPESITCVEQKEVKGIGVTFIWVGNKSYILEVSLEDFYKSLGIGSEKFEYRQEFAG